MVDRPDLLAVLGCPMTVETMPTVEPLERVRERTVSDVLLAAARYIEEHGWWQSGSELHGPAGACMLTAIGHVTDWGEGFDQRLNERLLREATLRARTVVGSDLPVWNDAPGRTEAEVIAALREAAR